MPYKIDRLKVISAVTLCLQSDPTGSSWTWESALTGAFLSGTSPTISPEHAAQTAFCAARIVRGAYPFRDWANYIWWAPTGPNGIPSPSKSFLHVIDLACFEAGWALENQPLPAPARAKGRAGIL